MTPIRSVALALSAVLLAACGDDSGAALGTDGGPPPDSSRVDAGPLGDAGPGRDAGPGVDGGPRVDGGPGTDAGPRTDGGSACAGGCAAGFSCTAAGYCATAGGVPAFGHVYVIVFENKSLGDVMGSASAPYLNGLMTTYASATAYAGVTNPSLPNYIAMTSGDTWGIGCDCHPTGGSSCNSFTCNLALSSCNCHQDHTHIGDQLDAAGIAWRAYAESMGTPCNPTDASSAHYAAKHMPFLYYDDVFTDSTRCAERLRDYSDFAADLSAGTYRFSYVAPNLCNDMHDSCAGGDSVQQGDDWAAANIPPILGTPGFGPGGTDVLFVVWDEEAFSFGSGRTPIPFIVASPLVEAGGATSAEIDHYALLATIEDGLGLARIGNAVGAPVITGIWR